MLGYRFDRFVPPQQNTASFNSLLDIFLQLLTIASGDVAQALSWLNELDRQYSLTDDSYGMGNFIDDLKKNGYLSQDDPTQKPRPTAKTERAIRQKSLDDVFGKLRKAKSGNHRSPVTGLGDERTSESRPYEFGDTTDHIDVTESLRNAQIHHGLGDFTITEDDLQVRQTEYRTSVSTALLIDISHSMILYGEDRITPAKQVAMALAELITTRYPKDTLDIIAFGDDANAIEIKDLPYLQVGPYHTNTVAGLEMALDVLRRRKTPNKQIFMITDGKPTCLKEGAGYYKNSFGLDRKILARTLHLAARCRRLHIPVTTFMVARDPYLVSFVREFTKTNQGRAFYSSLEGLGDFVFEDFERNRRKNVR